MELQTVVFRLGNEEYGIDINNAREIVRIQNITKIPGSLPHIKGMVNLRGYIIPVVDLKKWFSIENNKEFSTEREDDNPEMDRNTRMIVLNVNEQSVGIIVDAVSEILRIDEDKVEQIPSVGESTSSTYVQGVAKIDERIIVLLDLEKIFQ